MAIHIHTVDPIKHNAFLREERKDPFTKEKIKAGDRIVFCAKCKSAFLYSSWQLMQSKHCKQQNTLSEFSSIEIAKTRFKIVQNPSSFQRKTLPNWINKITLFALGGIIIAFSSIYFIKFYSTNIKNVPKTLYEEDFSSPNGWRLVEGAEFKDESLFYLIQEDNTYGLSLWNLINFRDSDFSIDVSKVDGDENIFFGIASRINGRDFQQFYYLLINSSGYFSMGKHSEDQWNDRIVWKMSNSINTSNSKNRLRIVSKGETIIGYINEDEVGRFKDKAYEAGKVGVISNNIQGNEIAVYYDNMLVEGTSPPTIGIEMIKPTNEVRNPINEEGNLDFPIIQNQGVLISKVYSQSPAQKAGLQVRDIIIKIDDNLIETSDEVQEVLRTSKLGETLKLEVIRRDKIIIIKVRPNYFSFDFNS